MDPIISQITMDMQSGMVEEHKIPHDPFRSRLDNIRLAYREALRLAWALKRTILAMEATDRPPG